MMTGEDFKLWLRMMKDKHGLNKQQCGELLGHGSAWVSRAQVEGANKATALACAACLAGLRPFTSGHATSSRPRSTHRDHA